MGFERQSVAESRTGRPLANGNGRVAIVFDHTKADYREQILKATSGRGVDLILEMLANVNLGHDLKLLSPHGRVVVIGSRGDVTISPRDLMTRRGSIHAFTLWGITEAEEKEVHAGLIAGLENGTLRPIVGKELPLGEAPRAHKEILEPGPSAKSFWFRKGFVPRPAESATESTTGRWGRNRSRN